MVGFIQSAEQFVNANESVVFVNNTDSSFEVGTGIIFRKSGLYEVSVVGNRITVTKVSDLIRKALEQELCEDMGEVSDGYHTFNQLYHQRAVLFATIVNQNKDKSWKSFKHSDGNYCFDSNGEWFIVGVDTPKGSYTYHYSKEYWNMFDCEELECGKEWDGHTEEDVTRLLSLEQEPCENAKKYFDTIYELSQTCGLSYSFIDEKIKEIVMGLKALPKKFCEDCISRKETLKALTDEWTEFDSELIDYLIEKIDKLPSVTPQEPKIGYWIKLDNCSNGGYYCSECSKRVVKEGWSDTVKAIKYCPNCGSRMMQEVKKNEQNT